MFGTINLFDVNVNSYFFDSFKPITEIKNSAALPGSNFGLCGLFGSI